MRRISAAGIVLLVAIALAACAARPAGGEAVPSSSPTPTAACPAIEGVDLPPDCAPYDPDAAMQQNDRYRQRLEITDVMRQAMEDVVEPLRAELESVRASGEITGVAVERAVREAGLGQAQWREGAGDVLFGISGPEGGCLYGAVTPEEVTVQVGGVIQDGGCLPAQ